MTRIERTTRLAAISLGLTLCSAACTEQNDAPRPPAARPQTAAEAGDAIEPAPKPDVKQPAKEAPMPAQAGSGDPVPGQVDYQLFCASCHGTTGDGDGPVAQALDPKPARHSDGTYMNALSHDDLFQIIKFGGQSVGKSPLMAPWGAALSDQQIENVIAFVRTLANPPYQP
jgi:mono/diheme cytochrome c family protein